MAKFAIAFDLTQAIEKGYVIFRTGNAGETYKGIDRKKNPQWPGWKRVDSLKNIHGFPGTLERDLVLQDLIHSFYKTEYWDALSLDQVNSQAIANELFDTGVLCGTGTSSIFLQRVLNVSNKNGQYFKDLKLDGNVGPVTISALNKHPRQQNVLKALNCLQGSRFITICEHSPSQEEYFHGWMERVFEQAA